MRSHSHRIGFCLGLLVTVIVSSLIGPSTALAREIRGTTSRGEQANIVAAAQDAESHLGQLQLPPDATSFASQPAGTSSHLASPAFTVGLPFGSPRLIDLPEWWLVPGQPQEVLGWIEAHPPPGSIWRSTSSDEVKGLTEAWSAGFEWPPISEVVRVRYLVVNVTAAPNGTTGLRADGEDVWTIPRPPSEQIPRTARILEVGRVIPGHGAPKTIVITRARTVHAVAALIDGLSIAQPGRIECGPLGGGPSATFTLTFRATRSGPALAQAVQGLPVSLCSDMGLTIHGHSQPSLVNASKVIRRASALLAG